MESLDTYIVIDIFSRLPAESVLDCRQVCKSWRTALLRPAFVADIYIHHQQQLLQLDDHNYHNQSNNSNDSKVGFVSLISSGKYGHQLYYGDLNGNEMNDLKISSKKLRKITSHPLLSMIGYSIVGSCNGLICFSEHLYTTDVTGRYKRIPAYIYNPITKEFMNLPRFNVTEYDEIVLGFGYHPSTYEYKVLTICYGKKKPRGQVYVYTLGGGNGSGRWRTIGNAVCSVGRYLQSYGILANGALHWIESSNVVSFDLADEKFSLLALPPCFARTSYYDRGRIKFQVLEGWLCIVCDICLSNNIDIWLLKKNEDSSSNYNMKNQDSQYTWSWVREFSVAYQGLKGSYEPVCITKNSELILRYKYRSLYRYNANQKTLKLLVDYNYDHGDYNSEEVPHINSFVSLKALGEQNVHIPKQTRKR